MAETSTLILKLESAKYNRDIKQAIENTEKLNKANQKLNTQTTQSSKEATKATKGLTTAQAALGGAILGKMTKAKQATGGVFKAFEKLQDVTLGNVMRGSFKKGSLQKIMETVTPFGGFNKIGIGQAFKAHGLKGAAWKVTQKFNDKLDNMALTLDRGVNKLNNFRSSMISTNTLMWGLTAAIAAANLKLLQFIGSTISAANAQELLEAKMTGVLRATKFAAGMNLQQMKDYAMALQKQTGVSDNAILNAMALVSTFNKIRGPIFKQAIASMLDASKVMGTNLREEALRLAKALQDPIRGFGTLREVGVSFTAQQEKQIKAFAKQGKIIEAQKLLLEAYNQQFGKTAELMGDTTAGKIDKVGTAWQSFKESFGGVVKALLPINWALGKMANHFNGIAKGLEQVRIGLGKMSTMGKVWEFMKATLHTFTSNKYANIPGLQRNAQGIGQFEQWQQRRERVRPPMNADWFENIQKGLNPDGSTRGTSSISTNFVSGARFGSVEAARTAGQSGQRIQNRIAKATEMTAQILERMERKMVPLTPGYRLRGELAGT